MVVTSESAQRTGSGLREGTGLQRFTPIVRRVLTSGWLPAALALVITVPELFVYGVPVATTAKFLGYVLVFLTVPGVLLWRVAYRRSHSFVEDLAAGTALGYAIEVLGYIPARTIGLPLLSMVPPLATIVAFLAVPRLRRYWRVEDLDGSPPLGWSWTLAGTWALIMFWATQYFRTHGLRWPSYATPDLDTPFHLALIGEAKHHFPLSTPWVSGEPVLYHWFVYADMAATSWVTGIEPTLLLERLSMLPMLAAFAVLVSAIARRLTGKWWPSALAVVITFFVLAPNPYGWGLSEGFTYWGFSAYDDGSSFRTILWTSPTQTFGALLFAPVVLVLIDLLATEGRDLRRWTLFTVMIVSVMGGKATYLPILLAALLLIVAVHLAVRRRVSAPTLTAIGITFVCLIFAQVVLFGGASQGLKLQPLDIMRFSAAGGTTSFVSNPRSWRLAVLAVITVFCWASIWSGVVGLRRRILEPGILLLLGTGLAGIGAILVLGHPGGSQGFFLQSARPYLAIAAVCGLVSLVPRLNRRMVLLLSGAAAAGVVVTRLIRMVSGGGVPTMSRVGGAKWVAVYLTWPYALLLALFLVGGFGLWYFRQRLSLSKATVVAMVVSMAGGAGLLSTYIQLSTLAHDANSQGWRETRIQMLFITNGTMEAGRWLRGHSSPDDLVATNAHCLPLTFDNTCLNLHFAISAFTERRVLIEGWGFTATAHEQADKKKVYDGIVPYWKPQILADNEAAFHSPSAETIGKLRDRYKVRWLFVDESVSKPPADLTRFATLRYRFGPSAVYEINR
jgi:hypothetical protein